MRELRWNEKCEDSQMVRVWMRSDLYGFEMEPFDCLASSLHHFDGMGIACVEII